MLTSVITVWSQTTSLKQGITVVVKSLLMNQHKIRILTSFQTYSQHRNEESQLIHMILT